MSTSAADGVAEPDDDLPSILDGVRRYWLGVLVAPVAAALITYALAGTLPVSYTASARVFLAAPAEAGADVGRFARTAESVARSRPVLARAAGLAALGGAFDEAVEVEAVTESVAEPDADALVTTATAADPEVAAALATAVARAYGEQVRADAQARAEGATSELRGELEDVESQLDVLQSSLGGDDPSLADESRIRSLVERRDAASALIREIEVQALLFGDGVRLVDPPQPPDDPSFPRPRLAGLVAGALVGLLAVGAAWWRNSERQIVTEAHGPARVLGAPLLGEVRLHDARAGAVVPAASPLGEAYRLVAASLTAALGDTGTVVLTSVTPRSGATLTALNVATAIAETGRPVCIVDADVRSRSLTAVSALSDGAGLAELGDEGFDLREATALLPVTDSVRLLAVGPGSRPLSGRAARLALARLRSLSDVVVVDAPPIGLSADTSVLAAETDGIVLVVREGTSLQALDRAAQRLAFVGAPLLGYVYSSSVRLPGGQRRQMRAPDRVGAGTGSR